MRNVAIAACVLALASAAAPLMAQDKSDLAMRLKAILGDFHDRYGFPGATAAIVLPEGMAATAATGLADLENGRIMTPDTPMLAASIGKTFVAATVLSLENERLLSRADLLSAHLGDRPWFDALPNADSITIDHLLHHTSGLPDHVHLPAFQEEWERLATDESDFDPERLVTFVAGEAPLFEVGTDSAYSDTGYVLLGLVIEEVTGQPWHEAVRSRFLGPLALSGTVPSDRPDLPWLAIGYVAAKKSVRHARTYCGFGRTTPGEPSREVCRRRLRFDIIRSCEVGPSSLRRRSDDRTQSRSAARRRAGRCRLAGHPLWRGRRDLRRYAAWAGLGPWRLDPRLRLQPAPLRRSRRHGPFQINTDVGIMNDTTDLVPELEAALADLVFGSGDETDQP